MFGLSWIRSSTVVSFLFATVSSVSPGLIR